MVGLEGKRPAWHDPAAELRVGRTVSVPAFPHGLAAAVEQQPAGIRGCPVFADPCIGSAALLFRFVPAWAGLGPSPGQRVDRQPEVEERIP